MSRNKQKVAMSNELDELTIDESDSDEKQLSDSAPKTSSSPSKSLSKSSSPAKKSGQQPFRFTKAVMESHEKQIFGCAFSPYILEQDPVLATVGSNKVTIYECPKTKSPLLRVLAHFKDPSPDESFYCCTWLYCPDMERHMLAVAGLTGLIRILSPSNGQCLRSIYGHGEPVNELAVHPKNSVIFASAGKDFTIRLWNATRDECLGIFGGVEGHRDQVLTIDFCWSGEYILSGSMDHTVKLWDVRPGTIMAQAINESETENKIECREEHFPIASTRDIHTNYVDCVRFYHKFIYSKSCENSVHLWKFGDLDDEGVAGRGHSKKIETAVTHYSEMHLPDAEMWFNKFAIDPLNRWIVVGNLLGEIRFWPISDDRAFPNGECSFVLKHKHLGAPIRQLAFSDNGLILIAVADSATVWRFDRNTSFKDG